MDQFHCDAMEFFGSRPSRSIDFCRKRVRRSRVFIGVLGWCYGSSPKGNKRSFTEEEFLAAVKEGECRRAAGEDLPILMFISEDNFPLPSGMTQSVEARERQRAFREHIATAEGWTCKRFGTPEELTTAVAQALSNLSFEFGGDPNESPPSRRKRSPGYGELTPKMCNRGPQDERFADFFAFHLKHAPGAPQVVFVCGAHDERPDSLVERLKVTVIRKHTDRRGVIHEPQPPIKWPPFMGRNPRKRCDQLIERVFEVFGCASAVGDPERAHIFAEAATRRRYPVVILQHWLRAAECDATVFGLIGDYLLFWDEIARLSGGVTRPQMVIFVHFRYPEFIGWKRWLPWLFFRRKKLERQLDRHAVARMEFQESGKALPGCCPVLRLDELGPVQYQDVVDWFLDFGIRGERHKLWMDRCKELFHAASARPMVEVEHVLTQIYDEFVNPQHYRNV